MIIDDARIRKACYLLDTIMFHFVVALTFDHLNDRGK